MAISTPDKSEERMNLVALQKVDPFIATIEASAKQVAVYKFCNEEWEKTEMEGTLFVCGRAAGCQPRHAFIVINRLSSRNLLEPVTQELNFQLQAPFLLYKTKDGDIFGIWFYKEEECVHVSKLIQVLAARSDSSIQEGATGGGGGGGGKDLNALLARAQKSAIEEGGREHTAKKTKASDEGNKLMRLLSSGGDQERERPTASPSSGNRHPSPPTLTSSIVNGARNQQQQGAADGGDKFAAFVQQVGMQQQQQQHQLPPQLPLAVPAALPGALPHGQPPPIMAVPILPPAMHHMMAMNAAAAAAAAHAQVTAGPSAHAAGGLPLQAPAGAEPALPDPKNPMLARLLANPSVQSVDELEERHRLESVSPALPPMPSGGIANCAELESDLTGRLNISGGEAKAGRRKEAKEELSREPEAKKLMSPMAFAQGTKHTPKRASMNGNAPDGGDKSSAGHRNRTDITPLTRDQLLQAFEHLLRTDTEFVGRLHRAYVDSLQTKLA